MQTVGRKPAKVMGINSIKFIIIISILLSFCSYYGKTMGTRRLSAGPVADYLEPGLYLIVGTFEFERNASNFTKYLINSGKDSAHYAFYPPKNYYYVHLGKYENKTRAMKSYVTIRAEDAFDDAWLFMAKPYTIPKESEPEIISAKVDVSAKQDLTTTPEVASKPEESVEITVGPDSIAVKANLEEENLVLNKSEVITNTVNNPKVQIAAEDIGKTSEGDFKVYLNTYREKDFKEVDGVVEVIDPDKLRRVKFIDTHTEDTIQSSFNRSGNIEMICEIFGYKKIQHDFNINNPFEERTEPFLSYDDKNNMVVDFSLQRYTKGDLVTMYNVYFYKDAAIMRPESHYELNQLVEMLKENREYEIMIHGHTNGNAPGPIITMEEGSDQFFSKSGPTKEGNGSAKKLSQARADLIKRYLINEGISEDRMTAKGWGGKKAIYKKLDPLAYKNVRVEIEILVD